MFFLIMGNLKFDAQLPKDIPEKIKKLKSQLKIDKQFEKIAAAQEKLEVLEDFREQQGEE